MSMARHLLVWTFSYVTSLDLESFLIGTPTILLYVHLFCQIWTMVMPSYMAPLTQTTKASAYPGLRVYWAAKLINCALKKDHATSYLREQHWLSVRERITFKILVYIYKCIHELAPPYLTSLLRLHCPARPGLCSASDTTRQFQHKTIRSLQTASNQTFSIAAPQIWKSLAISIRNSPSLDIFKKLSNANCSLYCLFCAYYCFMFLSCFFIILCIHRASFLM